MRRGRGAQLESLLEIINALQAHHAGLTLAELAERTRLHPRSVRRYVDDIAPLYFPIESVQRADGRRAWRFIDGAAGKAVVLGIDECLALARLHSVAPVAVAGLPWRGALERLFARLDSAVPAPLRAQVEKLLQAHAAAPAQGRGSVGREVYACFEDAARERHALAVRYRSLAGRARVRRFDPYVVYVAEGNAYAYGWDHAHAEPRVLALDRVRAVLPLAAKFERPPGFSPERFVDAVYRGYHGGRPLPIELRLTGRAAELWAERPEVPEQKSDPLPDGSLLVTFAAPDSEGLVARLLSFGAELEVLGPASLRKRVAEEVDRSGEMYRRSAADIVGSSERGSAARKAKAERVPAVRVGRSAGARRVGGGGRGKTPRSPGRRG